MIVSDYIVSETDWKEAQVTTLRVFLEFGLLT